VKRKKAKSRIHNFLLKEVTMDTPLLEIYTDYLISSLSQTTATGLSKLFDNEISHDKENPLPDKDISMYP
jgi:hypothetical protein